MFDDTGHVERSDIARRHIDALEAWMRRLVDYALRPTYGTAYLTTNPCLKAALKLEVGNRLAKGPPGEREVDGTTFGQLLDVCLNQQIFAAHIRAALAPAHPAGIESFRLVAQRLLSIRNKLAHGHPCSSRDTARAVCYSEDIIEALVDYFRSQGLEREFDVPLIIAYVDSLGNSSKLTNVPLNPNSRIIDWRREGQGVIRSGITLTAEVEVDPTFSAAEYAVEWYVFGGPRHQGSKAVVEVTDDLVGEQFELAFEVRTSRAWHRHFGIDDRLCLLFKVLPPV